MKAKEKAKELIDKYQETAIIEYTEHAGLKPTYSKLNDREAKHCAILLCNEMLHLESLVGNNLSDNFYLYWEQVKIEINNL